MTTAETELRDALRAACNDINIATENLRALGLPDRVLADYEAHRQIYLGIIEKSEQSDSKMKASLIELAWAPKTKGA